MKAIQEQKHGGGVIGLAFAALGVVYGDIGTSPLYALNETYFSHWYPLARTPENIFGVQSLVFWSITLVVSVKYITLVMRADNLGEGGIFALLSILRNGNGSSSIVHNSGWRKKYLPMLLVLGACLLYADGMITPAISIISAYEGLGVVSVTLVPFVIPLSVLTTVVLFAIQSRGTHRIGNLFGPVTLIWFITIAVLGAWQIAQRPEVLLAVNPWYAIVFCAAHGLRSFIVFGSVVLCITGGEALYADMGHFGAKPIRLAWFWIVCPAIMLNYFGQGAKMLGTDEIMNGNIFYSLVPKALLVPMVILSTMSTCIASQALISGAFSLTKQANQLGLLPRVFIKHTNADQEGQIYIPVVNWIMCLGTCALIVMFQTSGALAAAYGIAVTGTMAITTIGTGQGYLDQRIEKLKTWSPFMVLPLCLILVMIDLAFFSANSLKFFHGGWVPILIAVVLYTIMDTWQWGRENLKRAFERYQPRFDSTRVTQLMESGKVFPEYRIYMTPIQQTSMSGAVPMSLQLGLEGKNNYVPGVITFLTIKEVKKQPYIEEKDRIKEVLLYNNGQFKIRSIMYQVGFMDFFHLGNFIDERVGQDVDRIVVGEEDLDFEEASFFIRQRARLFSRIMKNTTPIHRYYKLGKKWHRKLMKRPIPIDILRDGTAVIPSA